MTMYLSDLGRTIRAARQAHGLTQAELATKAGLGRTTLNQLENGVFPDLGVNKVILLLRLLGHDLAVVPMSRKTSPDYLKMAASSASVSYKETLSPETLERIILTGKVPSQYRPHLRVIFDELPAKVLEGIVAALDSVAKTSLVEGNLSLIAAEIGTRQRAHDR